MFESYRHYVLCQRIKQFLQENFGFVGGESMSFNIFFNKTIFMQIVQITTTKCSKLG